MNPGREEAVRDELLHHPRGPAKQDHFAFLEHGPERVRPAQLLQVARLRGQDDADADAPAGAPQLLDQTGRLAAVRGALLKEAVRLVNDSVHQAVGLADDEARPAHGRVAPHPVVRLRHEGAKEEDRVFLGGDPGGNVPRRLRHRLAFLQIRQVDDDPVPLARGQHELQGPGLPRARCPEDHEPLSVARLRVEQAHPARRPVVVPAAHDPAAPHDQVVHRGGDEVRQGVRRIDADQGLPPRLLKDDPGRIVHPEVIGQGLQVDPPHPSGRHLQGKLNDPRLTPDLRQAHHALISLFAS